MQDYLGTADSGLGMDLKRRGRMFRLLGLYYVSRYGALIELNRLCPLLQHTFSTKAGIAADCTVIPYAKGAP